MRYDSRSKTWLTENYKTATSILEVPLNPRSSLYINEAEEQNKTLKVISIEYSDLVFTFNGAWV